MHPKIRFESEVVNDYPSWGKQPLGNIILKMSSGLSRQLKTENVGLAVIRSNNMADKYTTNKDIKYWYEDDPQGANTSNYILEEGDILVNFINSLSQIGKTSLFRKLPNTNTIYTTNILRLKLNPSQVNELFFFYFTKTVTFETYIRAITKPAVNQASFTTKEFVQLEVPLPCLQEQQKIADFLTSVDTKISQLTEKHCLLKDYKKGVMQQIFSQKIRFKDDDGSAFPDWQTDRLDWFINRVNEPVDVEHDEKYREIGIRCHGKGIFHKVEKIGCELGGKRVFWVHPRALIINIVFAWERAVAVTSGNEKGFIASHRFPMFIPVEGRSDLDYLLYFFLSPKGEYLLNLASPGGAGRNKTLGQTEFARLKVHLPCLKEQQKIAQFLQSIDKKIDAVNEQIEQIKLFKKGLLQQMFV